jgi:hypothetical protein
MICLWTGPHCTGEAQSHLSPGPRCTEPYPSLGPSGPLKSLISPMTTKCALNFRFEALAEKCWADTFTPQHTWMSLIGYSMIRLLAVEYLGSVEAMVWSVYLSGQA